MRRKTVALTSVLVVTVLIMSLVSTQDSAFAQKGKDLIIVDLIGLGPGAGAVGLVVIDEKRTGPDKLELQIDGLPPNQRITVFLTTHPGPGKLPAQFIGEFTTNKRGEGKLRLRAEFVSAFASANQTLEDAFGEANNPTAGQLRVPLGGTANTIPLNWFRGYFVDIFPHNVFGPDENTPGGAIAFISDPARP